MIDLLFLAHNRLEFTRACVDALIANTDWSLVRQVWVYDDASTDGTREYLHGVDWPVTQQLKCGQFGGPVAIMNHFLERADFPEFFAKIDNDTLVPPRWLAECLDVMERNPSLDLLGIECSSDTPESRVENRGIEPALHIGGIGLMRGRAFQRGGPTPDGRQGFTQWQHINPSITKAWMSPPIPVALLDHLPMEPWRSLNEKYEAAGWQRRPWGFYEERSHRLWDWWAGGKGRVLSAC